MNDFFNSIKSVALGVGERLTPILKESKFKETGVLTPDEFVAAGDHLVYTCKTWSWSSSPEANKAKDFLPPNKQYLLTKRVPCYKRPQSSYDLKLEMVIKEKMDDGNIEEWVDTHHFGGSDPQSSDSKGLTVTNEDETGISQVIRSVTGEPSDDDDDDAPPVDMDEFLNSGALDEDEDPNRFIKKKQKDNLECVDGEIEQTRTYDLHITYDKYYQVPRFWLIGYDENGQLLSVEQMKQDFSQDHADKTITLESHPFIGNLSFATIHPCRHASVMKQLINMFSDNGRELTVLDYLFIFLKFVQAVIPTIEYDYTRSICF